MASQRPCAKVLIESWWTLRRCEEGGVMGWFWDRIHREMAGTVGYQYAMFGGSGSLRTVPLKCILCARSLFLYEQISLVLFLPSAGSVSLSVPILFIVSWTTFLHHMLLAVMFFCLTIDPKQQNQKPQVAIQKQNSLSYFKLLISVNFSQL